MQYTKSKYLEHQNETDPEKIKELLKLSDESLKIVEKQVVQIVGGDGPERMLFFCGLIMTGVVLRTTTDN